jgi:glycosyltransferase involved in cell wall biosynthesis
MGPVHDPRLRVAFCIDSLHIGGTELNAVRLAERLDRSRFDLRVVCLRLEGPLVERCQAAGLQLNVFTPGPLIRTRAAWQGLRLRSYLRHHRIQVFHAHDVYSNVFGCPWARLAGAKVIASRRWLGTRLSGRAGRAASRLAYRLAHVALANSTRVADYLSREDRVPRRRIAVVPNFVDEDTFTPLSPAHRQALRDEFRLTEGSVAIGIVANLRPVKDHATLIRAFASLAPRWPRVRLILVGDGESRAELERLAAALGVGAQVVFAGMRSNHPNLNHLFDLSVLCSTSEGLPNSILEAMAAGRPVVATDVGAVADAVVDGQTGLLVPPSDPGRLAAALEDLLADPARARRLGVAGQRRARAVYSPEVALRALEDVYVDLVRPDGWPDRRRALEGLAASSARARERTISGVATPASGAPTTFQDPRRR